MADEDRRAAIIPGALLILLGLLFLAAQFLPGLRLGDFVVLVIGLVFLGAFAYQRQYGFLVPGGILTGLGLGIAVQSVTGQDLVVLGLGLGFLAVWALDAAVTRTSNWWPLIPGGVLVLVGLATLVPSLALVLARMWPLLLIAAGIVLVLVSFGRRQTR
jgi:hypothetical protein